uniref:Uncharacterized protein n=1 Tax=Paenibacillus athensensis TaxID=1967502 RepID=A0A4Y8Q3Z1_9BACL
MNVKLRIVWIIPLLFLSFVDIGLFVFILIQKEGLNQIGMFTPFALLWLLFTCVIIFGFVKYFSWIRSQKI